MVQAPVATTWITHYADLYGANRSMLDLVLQLRRTGQVDPHVVLPKEGPLSEVLRSENVPHAVVPLQPWMEQRYYMGGPHHRLGQWWRQEKAALARTRANRALLPELVEQLRRWNTRLVHLNSAVVPMAAAIRTASGLPLIWHIRELPERQYLLHPDGGARAYGKALCKADQVIAISQAVKADITRYAPTLTKVPVVYNGVLSTAAQQELTRAGQARWQSDRPFTFLLLGLIHPNKGQIEAVEAMALLLREHPEARLRIIGSGRSEPLQQRIAELAIGEHVSLEGFLNDPYPALLDSHALLMCSRNEAMGRVTVEAMACGLPVIGHASGGTLEIVEHERTGLSYPGGAVPLAQAMARLVADRHLARSLGDQGAQRAAQRFSIERYAEEVAAIYRVVLHSRR